MREPRYETGWARDEDWAEVGGLLRDALPGPIAFTMERRPDPRLAAAVEGDPHHVLVVRERASGRVVGMGSRAVRQVWLDGRRVRIGYLGQLRRAPDLVFGPSFLPGAFSTLERARGPDEVPFDLTSIMEDNRIARAVFERGWTRLPTYRPIARLSTLVFAAAGPRERRTAAPRPVAAVPSDLEPILDCLERNHRRFQLAPVWKREDLLSPDRTRGLGIEDFLILRQGDRVVACAALWDQRSFKQIGVDGYSRWLGALRHPLNFVQRLRSAPRLPAAGPLALGFLSHLAVDDDRPGPALALIDAARRRASARDLDYLALGLTDRHPLLAPVRRYRRAVEIGSQLYAVHRRPAPPELEALERLPVQPEAALL